jgi:hypothetical protein
MGRVADECRGLSSLMHSFLIISCLSGEDGKVRGGHSHTNTFTWETHTRHTLKHKCRILHVRGHSCRHAHAHTHTHTHAHAHTHACPCTHTHAHAHTHTHTRMPMHTHACAYTHANHHFFKWSFQLRNHLTRMWIFGKFSDSRGRDYKKALKHPQL